MMGDIDFVAKNLNALNTILTYFFSVGVNMDEKDHCMIFFVLFSIFVGQPSNGHWKNYKEIGA